MKINIFYSILFLPLVFFSCGSEGTTSVEPGIDGDYLFVEMRLFSYANLVSGECDSDVVGHTGIQYEYDEESQILNYRAGPLFPVNEQLQLVFAQQQLFDPPSLAGGGDLTFIVPTYFSPDQLTSEVYLEGIGSSQISLQVDLKYSSLSIDLPNDSTFTTVEKTTIGGPGIDCIWVYTDSLLITNYGYNPKQNIVREF